MVKILIFRTDRIGDLIVTCPAIISIKKYFKECNITLIASNKNYRYAESLKIFDKIIKLPKINIFNKISLIYKLNKEEFDYIFIFDGKERSILTSYIIRSKFKVALSQSIKIYYKFLNIKFVEDNENTNLNDIFQKMIDYCRLNTKIANYDFIKNKEDNNFASRLSIDRYVHIHLDEKWYNNLYIKSYTNINLKYEDFITLINSISNQSNILITTGVVDISIVNDLKEKFFKKIDEKIYYRKNFDKSIYLIYKPSFEDIESLLRKSKILITCHGSITHAANSFLIKKIDILEKNKIKFYKRFTSYLQDYHPIYRSNFDLLRKEISKKIHLVN